MSGTSSCFASIHPQLAQRPLCGTATSDGSGTAAVCGSTRYASAPNSTTPANAAARTAQEAREDWRCCMKQLSASQAGAIGGTAYRRCRRARPRLGSKQCNREKRMGVLKEVTVRAQSAADRANEAETLAR